MRWLYQTLLGAWLGASLAIAAIVAPALFRVAPEQAGAVVRQIFPVLDASTFAIAAAAIAIALRVEGRPKGRSLARVLCIAAMALFAAVNLFAITPRVAALRELPKDDPARAAFGPLHGASQGLLLGEMLLAVAACALPLRKPE